MMEKVCGFCGAPLIQLAAIKDRWWCHNKACPGPIESEADVAVEQRKRHQREGV